MFLVPDILFFQEEDIIFTKLVFCFFFVFFLSKLGIFILAEDLFYSSIPYILKIGLLFKKNMYSLPPLI